MSKVWRASDSESGRTVVVKVLDKIKTDHLKQRFIGLARPDEGEVAMSLTHPNIVKTYEYGFTNKNEEYLVMELIEGVGFNFLVETRSKQLVGNELDFLIPLGEALAYFHQKGYIHRDICPRNAMITNNAVVKLIDFGLAVPNEPEFRRPGNRTGTATHMAPELIKRAPTDQRIDIFSFGVTCYEAYTGAHPWEATASFEAMLKHINTPPRDPRETRPDLPEPVVKMILKSIENDPSRRFQTMNQMISVMRGLRGDDD
jgi:serine/threonine protein kinase